MLSSSSRYRNSVPKNLQFDDVVVTSCSEKNKKSKILMFECGHKGCSKSYSNRHNRSRHQKKPHPCEPHKDCKITHISEIQLLPEIAEIERLCKETEQNLQRKDGLNFFCRLIFRPRENSDP
jgi:hypothetical protein